MREELKVKFKASGWAKREAINKIHNVLLASKLMSSSKFPIKFKRPKVLGLFPTFSTLEIIGTKNEILEVDKLFFNFKVTTYDFDNSSYSERLQYRVKILEE